MKPIFRIFRYLKHFPTEVTLNILFNILHIAFNLGSYVMIVPFVELLFGQGGYDGAEPAFGLSQQQLTDWAFWHLHRYQDTLGLWTCLLIVAEQHVPLFGGVQSRRGAHRPHRAST